MNSDNNNDNNDTSGISTISKISSLSCYELGQIMILPMKPWDTTWYRLGQHYNIYNRQQHIVTLCLLFAALHKIISPAYGKKTINKITNNLLYPTKVRKESSIRIESKNRNQNNAFQNIITASDNNNNNCITENYN